MKIEDKRKISFGLLKLTPSFVVGLYVAIIQILIQLYHSRQT